MAALPLSADPALDALLPLMEVYGPDGHNPPYDVAGIRCAALWTAQIAWGQSHGERVRVDRQMEEDLDTFLDRSMSGRVEAGMDLTRAYTTVYEDTEQVIARYTARFQAYVDAGHHPWRNDPLVIGDTNYCQILRG